MTTSTACFTHENIPLNELWNKRRKWKPIWFTTDARKRRREASCNVAILIPSLGAEMTPLVLFWGSHIPVWQMSAFMAGAWVFAWWLTWIIAMPLWKLNR